MIIKTIAQKIFENEIISNASFGRWVWSSTVFINDGSEAEAVSAIAFGKESAVLLLVDFILWADPKQWMIADVGL